MTTSLLDVASLNAWYGRAQVLFGMSFSVDAGEAVVLLGRNGAGKSTTMRALVQMVPQVSGRIVFDGQPIQHLPTYRIARMGLAYVPEDRRIFTDLTVMENLSVGRQPPRDGEGGWTVEQLFDLFPNLGRMRDRRGGEMSGGEQQMLTIARALMGNPRFLLLDEPSEGLAPVIVEGIARAMVALKERGVAMLLSEQNLHFARSVADRAYVMERGQIRFAGTIAALDASPDVREQYLAV
jgi:branched-chain amino acid transport system ATP-binding protein